MSVLSSHLLLLLLAEASLSGQTRTVGHTVCVRVLPPALPHKEQPDDAQELAAPWLQWNVEAIAETDSDHESIRRPRTASSSQFV